MRFILLLCWFAQISAAVTVREKTAGGFWLESHINDDRTLAKLIFSDGSSVIYDYEDARLQKITRLDSLGREVYSQSYTWNDSRLDTQVGWFNTQYFYDESGRIIARLNPWNEEIIEYDGQGQAIRIGDRTYCYDCLGQITVEHGFFEALYDADYGIEKLNKKFFSPLQMNDFQYDENGWLIEAYGKRYSYDIFGRCLQKGDTSYLYLGFEEIASFEDGICKTLKIPGIGGPIAIEIEGKPYAPIVDAQGIIRKLIDPANNSIYAENHCDVFGAGLTEEIPYAYRGKRYDEETNLLYFGKRYYDPSSHRWLTPDPLGSIDHDNLYQYVYNNPIRYSDPIGCSFWGYVLGLGEIVAGGALMLTGGVIEVGSFGTLTLGFMVAESSGVALMAHGWARATYESLDMKLPRRNQGAHSNFIWKETTKKTPRFDGKDLGEDPSHCPEEGFEWKGKDKPGTGKGSWVKGSRGSQEILHPDLDHPSPIGPHWDYESPDFPAGARLFPDGTWEPK